MMLTNKNQLFIFGTLLLFLMFAPLSPVLAENSEYSQNQTNSDNHLRLSQVGIVQPNLFIRSIVINNGKLPEEGDKVEIDIEIINEDDVAYIGLGLVIEIKENKLVQHGPAPMPDIYNKSLDVVPSKSTLQEQIPFKSRFGKYTLTASLATNSSVLPNSVRVMNFQVINKPIGSMLFLTIAIFSVILLLLILVATPLFIEKFRLKYMSQQ